MNRRVRALALVVVSALGLTSGLTLTGVGPAAAQPASVRHDLASNHNARTPSSQLQAFDTSDFDPTGQEPISSTATSDTYSVGNGVNVTELSNTPVNYQKADGSWTDINTTVSSGADGKLVVSNNPLHPEFANSADDDDLMSVSNGGYSLSFTLSHGESSSYGHRATLAGGASKSEVTYQDAAVGGADLNYQVGNSTVKESIELDAAPTDASSHWVWNVSAPGLNLEKNEPSRVSCRRFVGGVTG